MDSYSNYQYHWWWSIQSKYTIESSDNIEISLYNFYMNRIADQDVCLLQIIAFMNCDIKVSQLNLQVNN